MSDGVSVLGAVGVVGDGDVVVGGVVVGGGVGGGDVGGVVADGVLVSGLSVLRKRLVLSLLLRVVLLPLEKSCYCCCSC